MAGLESEGWIERQGAFFDLAVLCLPSPVAVVVLFTAAMFYVRWRARELRATDERQAGAGE